MLYCQWVFFFCLLLLIGFCPFLRASIWNSPKFIAYFFYFSTSLHPIRRAARFLVTHFLSPQSVKQFRQQHQHHYYHHQKQQSRHRYYTSFLCALKPSSRSHHPQHCDGNIRLKTRTPRRLHEVASASIIMTRNCRRHSHRRSDRECQRSVVGSGGGVLAKTLDLTHEGLIMTAAPMGSSSVNAVKTPSAGEVMSPSVGHKNSPKSGGPPQCLTTHSNSESSSEGNRRGIPLRHTRVRSVRVTVEPQVCTLASIHKFSPFFGAPSVEV